MIAQFIDGYLLHAFPARTFDLPKDTFLFVLSEAFLPVITITT